MKSIEQHACRMIYDCLPSLDWLLIETDADDLFPSASHV